MAGQAFAGEYDLAQAPVFFGWAPNKPANALSATDFIAAIRRKKGKHTWGDETTVNYATSSLRAEAAEWFEKSLPAYVDPVRMDTLRTSWEDFLRVFSKRYKAGQSVDEENVSLQIGAQQKGERASVYVMRIMKAFHGLDTVAVANSTPTEVVPVTILAKLEVVERDLINAILARRDTFMKRVGRMQVTNTLGKRMIRAGLSHPKIQTVAHGKLASTVEMDDFIQAICDKEDELNLSHSNGNGTGRNGNGNGNSNGPRHVLAVAETTPSDDEGDETDADVAAVAKQKTQKKGKKGTKKAGNGQSSTGFGNPGQGNFSGNTTGGTTKSGAAGNNRKGNPMAGATCTFCDKRGHTEATCYYKKGAEKMMNRHTNAHLATPTDTNGGNTTDMSTWCPSAGNA